MTARTWLLVAGAVLAAAVLLVTTVRVRIPSRPVRDIEALETLRAERPNVVFVLIDTLRADRLGSYGYERPTSRVIDDLASSGIRFAQVEAQSSWTKCSMASLWTGVFPTRTGVKRFDHRVPEGATMPAEVFRRAGYTTAGVYRNGWVATNFGFAQGFDLYFSPTPRRREDRRATPGATSLPGTDEDVSLAAIQFLETHRDEPFFLYLHFMDVHQYAYDQAAADMGFGSTLSDSYDAAIHWTDRNVYQVVSALDRLGLLDETLIVIASDHGEAFREHGIEGHARNLYREVTRVPLVFVLPFRLEDGLVVEPLVRNVDIWPTVFDLVGLPAPDGLDGQSLLPVIRAAASGRVVEPPPSLAFLDQAWGRMDDPPSPLLALHVGPRRLLMKPGVPGALELYDLATDPGERENLAALRPPWLAGLEQQARQRLAEPAAWGEAPEVEIDEMGRQQLQALGYVVK